MMKKSFLVLFSTTVFALALLSCSEKKSDRVEVSDPVEFNQALADELEKLAEIDQIAAYIRQGEYEKLTIEEWESFKDSVFRTHQKRMSEIFEEHGFAGFDLVGEAGSSNFWVMVQHSDFDPDFQNRVLEKMKIEVANGNAHPRNYGLLVDRVKLNTGEQQIYGTQVTYNMETGQAFPRNLADSLGANDRRKSLNFEPLEVYLNQMTESHFEMNRSFYAEKGVTEPTFYDVK